MSVHRGGDVGLLVARTWFVTDVAGSRRVVRGGMIIRADDPVVEGHEDLFEPASQMAPVAPEREPVKAVGRRSK